MKALRTPVCDLFGVELPIVQTGMGWVSGAQLTAATSAAGGLGILAAATLGTDELAAAIDRVQSRTDRPFGVNLRPDREDLPARCDLLIDRGVKVASFARAPARETIDRLKEAGVVVVPTVGARRHAEKVAAWGVDALICQGHEGGGHTGPIPTTVLLPQVCDAVDLPVLAAGGFKDGRGLVAALAFGAQGVAMGTRFLLTRESRVPDPIKARYLSTDAAGTVVTTAVDGVPQRVIRTDLVERLEGGGWLSRLLRAAGHALSLRRLTGATLAGLLGEGLALRRRHGLSWPQVALAPSAPMLTKAALVEGRDAAGILPTGQVVGRIDELPSVAEVIEGIVQEAEEVLKRMGAER